MLKKCAALIFSIVILVLALPCGFQTAHAAPAGYELIVKNSNYAMYFNNSTADVMIEDVKTGKTWTTIPPEWEEDPIKTGMRFNMASHIILTYFEFKSELEDNVLVKTVNSYTSSFKNGSYEMQKIQDGIRIVYQFASQQITVAIDFILKNDGLKVTVPVDSIIEEGFNKVSEIRVLPFFGAVKPTDNGYIFFPDGSGAIAETDNNFGMTNEVRLPIYGWDASNPIYKLPPNTETARMPVFGVKKNDTALFGIIEDGEGYSCVYAGVSNATSSYFRAYPSFVYRDLHQFILFEGVTMDSQNPRAISERFKPRVSKSTLSTDMTVNYYFLTGNDASYSGMAKVYREYLIQKGLKKNTARGNDFVVTLLGSLKMKTTFLGIPVTSVKPLTRFSEASGIIQDLKDKGIEDISMRYIGIDSGGYMDTVTSTLKPERKLGGASGLRNFLRFASDNSVDVYIDGQIIEINRSGNGFKVNRDAARMINNALVLKWEWNVINGKRDRTYPPSMYTSPASIFKYFDKFLASINRFKIDGMSLSSLGDSLYSEHRKNKLYYRDKTMQVFKDVLQKASENKKVLVTGGNAYALPYASMIVEMPLENSFYRIATDRVPFMQMVLHGYVPYAGLPMNLSSNDVKEFLKMLEYGALPHYEWIYADSSAMRRSRYNELFSGNYKSWIDRAAEIYKEMKEIYKDIYDKAMISHERLGQGVYKTTYENGVSIIVNYNDTDFYMSGVSVKGNNYLVLKEEIR